MVGVALVLLAVPGTSTAADETAGHDHYKHDGHHQPDQHCCSRPSVCLHAAGEPAAEPAGGLACPSLVGLPAIEPGTS
jgi:hypothetical protein